MSVRKPGPLSPSLSCLGQLRRYRCLAFIRCPFEFFGACWLRLFLGGGILETCKHSHTVSPVFYNRWKADPLSESILQSHYTNCAFPDSVKSSLNADFLNQAEGLMGYACFEGLNDSSMKEVGYLSHMKDLLLTFSTSGQEVTIVFDQAREAGQEGGNGLTGNTRSCISHLNWNYSFFALLGRGGVAHPPGWIAWRRWGWRKVLKLETLHGSLTLLEKELLLLEVDGRGQGRIFILCVEVALDQVKSLLVDLLVLMTL